MTSYTQQIIELLHHHPEGLQLQEITERLAADRSKRSIQRELHQLVQENKITREGKARSTRYFAHQPNPALPLATDAELKAIKAYLNQPLSQREKTEYREDFLRAYIPNTTYYLPTAVREHLKTIGQQPDGDQPEGTYAKIIFHRFLLDLSWNSSRLEGNTYSLLETEQLLLHHQQNADKKVEETQMILNHKAAIEFLIESIEHITINKQSILNLHALLSDNLISNPESIGNLRKIPAGVSRTSYQPLEIPARLETYFHEIVDKAAAIHDPFEAAFFLLVHIPYLQAFEDFNKRVSRLAANIPFIKKNLAPLSFTNIQTDDYIDAVLAVYELNDIRLLMSLFISGYEHSVRRYKVIKDNANLPDPFKMQYRAAIKAIVQKIILDKVNQQQVISFIRQWMEHEIPADHQAQFQAIIEQELMNLHIGNFVRYQVSEAELLAWQSAWNKH